MVSTGYARFVTVPWAVAGLIALAPVPAAATIDTAPPDLVDHSMSSVEIDLRDGPATLSVRIHVTDQTGAEIPSVTIRHQDTLREAGGYFPTRIEGDEKDGTYEYTMKLLPGDRPQGTWEIIVLELTDLLGNGYYDEDGYAEPILIGTVEVLNDLPEVTPEPISVIDVPGWGDRFVVPELEGVEYWIDNPAGYPQLAYPGVENPARAYQGYPWLVVFAEEKTGFAIPADVERTWVYRFDESDPPDLTYGFFLNEFWSGAANHVFTYGRFTDDVFTGDWNKDGKDTITVRRESLFYVSNTLGGQAEQVIAYGRPGDVVLKGDWDGDGQDSFAVRRGNEYHIKNSASVGPADQVLRYGTTDDEVHVGDWDGDGKDTLAVRRGNVYYVKNAIASGTADLVQSYGRADDEVYVGDWDGNGTDTLGVRRTP